ncbi:8-oxo-dGTP diphosphatase [Aliiroseovarius halocynthiae]|uniref:NUDIX domain-containing protein n=1 Tax=Aliiroseovarius halocynthiae TaxID=985055 RepID=A0A545SP46_9RHOB|nr:NUDIX hydrolase [Aliiroseovarius halocynthiae]TQV66749.1 NUDIX domain-containing protein [Aliiroseovarius halocynthiae]SMR82426.1 8-oxo-dGTP diphosphatase [Aliiroseovarius halocynthiae]
MSQVDYIGAKLVLLIGGKLVTLLRDDKPDIPFPNMWDLPGGGSEGNESPEDCVLRETMEELSLVIRQDQLVWKKRFESPHVAGTYAWWFGAILPHSATDLIQLGDEGQCWRFMSPEEWLANPRAIEHFKPRVRAGIAALTGIYG